MPEQKCLTIDGTQVLWKHYRKKQGSEDVVKFCFGKVLPESQWQTHRISHAIVNACTTKAALASAVRQLAAEVLGATIKPSKVVDCGCCKDRQSASLPPADTSKADQLAPTPFSAATAEEGCVDALHSLPTRREAAPSRLQADPLVDVTDVMPARMRAALETERSTTAGDQPPPQQESAFLPSAPPAPAPCC